MVKYNKKIIIILVIVLILIINLTFSGCLETQTNNNINKINGGEEFTYTSLEGNDQFLSNHRGKIVILDLWATWCSPCQYQMLDLIKLYENYSHKEVEILSINIDAKEDLQKIKDFINQFESYGYELNWIFGNEKDSLDKYMPTGGIPSLVIFDKDGNKYYQHTGYSPYDEIPSNMPKDTVTLKEKIEELIK